jgi:hypothetical protein
LLTLLLVSSLACGCIKKQDWKQLESKEGGFRLKYPSDWEVWPFFEESTFNVVFIDLQKPGEDWAWLFTLVIEKIEPPGIEEIEPSRNVTIGSITLPAPQAGLMEMLTEGILEEDRYPKNRECSIKEISNITFCGMPAQRIVGVVRYLDLPSKPSLKYIAIMNASKENKVYNVIFIYPLEEVDKWSKIFDQVIDSFEFNEGKPKEKEGWEPYELWKGEFRMKYPANWTLREGPLVGFFIMPENWEAWGCITVERVKNTNLREELKLKLDSLKESKSEVKETGFCTLGYKPAVKVVYIDRSEEEVSKNIWISSLKGNKECQISFSCPLDQFEKWSKPFKQIIRSFKFI